MTIPASRRDELRRLATAMRSFEEDDDDSGREGDCERCNTLIRRDPELDPSPLCNPCAQDVSAAVPDLLDEIERLEAESSKWYKAGADGIDAALEHGLTELGEAKLVIEQQDRDLERLRTALTDALACWRYPCLTAREKERKDEILAMLDE